MSDSSTDPKVVRSPEEWRKRLTDQQYEITRRKGTEPAFTGVYWNSKEAGVYRCACCDTPLFSSDTKYDSGTGWPSFWDVVAPENLKEEEDRSLPRIRTEILCSVCDAHLGHVFPDGPEPTGRRYCVNSASLKLDSESE